MPRNTLEQLQQRISMLENKQSFELQQLHEAFKEAYENLRIKDLVKEGVDAVVDQTEIKDNMVNSTIGAGAGFLAKRVLFGKRLGPIGGLLGIALQLGVTNLVTNNMDNIVNFGKKLINKEDENNVDEKNEAPKKKKKK
ncbi:MAG TPA: hypothetical protein VIK71_01340 [Flavobacteriales bacterium]